MVKGDKDKGTAYINLALEIDKNIEQKIENNALFAPIQELIRIPNENRKIKMKLSKKENEINEYLENMYGLVASSNLNNEEKEKNGNKEIYIDLEEKEQEQKERE